MNKVKKVMACDCCGTEIEWHNKMARVGNYIEGYLVFCDLTCEENYFKVLLLVEGMG
jgi:hypothetical protein